MSMPLHKRFSIVWAPALSLALAVLPACGGRDEPEPASTVEPAAETSAPVTPAAPTTTDTATTTTPAAPSAPPPPTPAPGTTPAPATTPSDPETAPTAVASTGAPAAPAAPGAGPANPGKLLPVDEAKRAPGLTDVRDRLERAVKERNKAAVLDIVAPNVSDEVQRAWKLDDPNSPFWTEMANVLRQGGSFGQEGGGSVFYAPHVYGRLPQGLDPSQYGVITGERVNVRREPNRTAPTVGQLTYEIVKLAPNPNPQTETIEGETHPWVAIAMPDGTTGYVYGRYIRSPQGLHARFERVGDQWKLTYFGEGK